MSGILGQRELFFASEDGLVRLRRWLTEREFTAGDLSLVEKHMLRQIKRELENENEANLPE